jgi:hypothetical protein
MNKVMDNGGWQKQSGVGSGMNFKENRVSEGTCERFV